MRDMEATNIDDETSSLKARLGALLDVRMPFLREVSEAEREEASHNLVIVLNESNKVFEAQAAQAAADQIKVSLPFKPVVTLDANRIQADEEAAAEAEGENTESLAAQQEAANKATNKAAKRKRARESKTLRAGYINHTKKMICRTCQKPNHIAKDCPDKHSKTPKGSHMKKSDPTNAPPTAGLPFSRQERVQMQAVFMVDEDHQTTVELEFVANYFRPGQQDVSDKDKKWTHPKAVLRLTPKNIAVPIEHRASWELEELLALGMPQSEAEAIKNDSFVQCAIITWGTCNEPDALERLGVSIFSDMEYGPFTEQMHSIRDLFHTPVKMHVFYTGEAGPCASEIAKINRSIQKQRETDPRGKWFKNGRCNPQEGQQIPKADRPTYVLGARLTMDSIEEWVTIFYHQEIARLESVDSLRFVKTKARLVQLANSDHQGLYQIHLERHPELNLSEGDILDLDWRTASGEKSWDVRITDDAIFSSPEDYTGFVRRKSTYNEATGETTWDDIVLEAQSIVKAEDVTTSEAVRKKLLSMRPIVCWVRVKQPKSQHQLQINMIRRLCLYQKAYQREIRLILANDLQADEGIMAPRNYFAPDIDDFGQKIYKAARSMAEDPLDDQQRGAFKQMEAMNGGVLCISGSGGTGKSTILEALAAYHYIVGNLDPEKKRAGHVLLCSTLNAQVNYQAINVHSRLLDCYQQLLDADFQHVKPPVVVRIHAPNTEKKLGEQQAYAIRQRNLPKLKELPFAPIELEDFREQYPAMMYALQSWDRTQMEGIDKRLVHPNLSQAIQMLQVAGVRDDQHKKHPIAHDDDARHYDFREYLRKYANGDNLSEQVRSAWTISANLVMKDLMEIADVILVTPVILAAAKIHRFEWRTTLLDEAGKATELQGVAPLIWSRAYTTPSKGQPIFPPHKYGGIPLVAVGDESQPQPARGEDDVPFPNQTPVSLFTRLLAAGVTQYRMYIQHRYTSDIAAFINSWAYSGLLQTDPAVDIHPESVRAKKVHSEIFDRDSSVIMVCSRRAVVEVNEDTKGVSNPIEALQVIYTVMRYLDSGIAPSKIAIGTPYRAQVKVLTELRSKLTRFAMTRKGWQHLAHEIELIDIFTIDGKQGQEAEYVVLSLCISQSLRFLSDDTRFTLACTRARRALVIHCNAHSLDDYNKGRQWGYGNKAVKKGITYLRQAHIDAVYDLDDDAMSEIHDKWFPPTIISNQGDLKRLYLPRLSTIVPFNLMAVSRAPLPQVVVRF